jgi:Protein of unknown function (DUF2550)
MIIALLAVLGVDLAVIAVFVAGLVARRRWLKHQPGAFKGAVRRASGDQIDGLGERWRRGCGRWVRDVLVWSSGPLHFRNVLIPVDSVSARDAEPGEVRRLGSAPVVIAYSSGASVVELAIHQEDRELALKPFLGETTVPPQPVQP